MLDAAGEAEIELPSWFDALNNEFRYQVTCMGGYAPIYIAVQSNCFKIGGGAPGMKVSWQVTGIRMTGNFRFSDKHFPANGKPPPVYFIWKDKKRQAAWWLESNRRKERSNDEGDLAGSSTPSDAPDTPSLAGEIEASRRKHRRRTGNGAGEPPQDG